MNKNALIHRPPRWPVVATACVAALYAAYLALGNLLLKRPQTSDKDYEDAEDLFLEALGIFERYRVSTRTEQLGALRGLDALYGPDIWDEPEQRMRVDIKIKTLEDAASAPDTARPSAQRPQG